VLIRPTLYLPDPCARQPIAHKTRSKRPWEGCKLCAERRSQNAVTQMELVVRHIAQIEPPVLLNAATRTGDCPLKPETLMEGRQLSSCILQGVHAKPFVRIYNQKCDGSRMPSYHASTPRYGDSGATSTRKQEGGCRQTMNLGRRISGNRPSGVRLSKPRPFETQRCKSAP
jgi:hypothetical protein